MNFAHKDAAAEIRAVFDDYERALAENDIERLDAFFWRDPRVVRLAPGGGAYGHEAIAAFRRGRDVADVARTLERVDVLPLAPDLGIASCEYRRLKSGRRGRQSQVWAKLPEGWRIVAAHVSLDPA